MDLKTVREGAEELTTALARARCEAGAGLRDELGLEKIFRAHPGIASTDALSLVREAQASSEGRRASRLGALAEHLYGLVEDASARDATEERQKLEAASTIAGTEPGEVLAFRSALAALPTIASRDARASLDARLLEAMARMNGAAARQLESAWDTAQRTLGGRYVDALGTVSGIDHRALAAECEAFLASTASMYEDVLAWWLRRTTGQRPFPHGCERHDLLHALRIAPFEGLFPRGDLAKPLAGRLAAIGLDPLAGGRIRIDGELRPKKTPRAFAAAISVPDEIVLVYRPRGGFDDTSAFLHELGHAQHFANVAADRPFEDRHLGDHSVSEGFAFLFDHLLYDRRWLKRALDAEAPDLVRVLALTELFRARRAAAKLVYEVGLHDGGLSPSQPQRYADLLSHATRAKWPAGLHLWDVDARLYVSRHLRGAALEAALFDAIRERFDEDWWANPRSGPWLRTLWAQGQFEPAHVLAERLGLGAISLARTAARLEALLS